jgi:gliding motility-associated-like protein
MEVSNANDGNAMALTASIKLPEGLAVLEGTSEVQYPAPGGMWVPVSNPQIASGNIYFWEMDALLPSLSGGLPGFEAFPANTFRLRFKTLASCGIVANAQPVFGISGVQPCGTFTNSLRKPGDPVGLQGLIPAYEVDISLSPVSSSAVSCGEELVVAAQLLLQGTPSLGDSVYLLLPQGMEYVIGSYVPGQNAPTMGPDLLGQMLRWPLSAGLVAGDVVKFTIRLLYKNAAACLDQFVIAQTRQQLSGFCPLLNQSCGVYVTTGEALMPVTTANPDLKITDFSFTGSDPNAGVGFTVTVSNPGAVAAQQALVQIWMDENENGIPDANDVLVQELPLSAVIPAGGTLLQPGSIQLPLEVLCKLLLVLPAEENCSCAPKYFPISGNPRATYELVRCTIQPVTFGVQAAPSHLYSWVNPIGLSCTSCAETTFQPGPNVQLGDAFTFLLQENTGSCILEHEYKLRYLSEVGIEGGNQELCKGDSLLLKATPGGSYQWSGGGITGTSSQVWVAPVISTSYQVVVTLPDGCADTTSILVDVLEAVQVDLGVVRICPGQEALILGVPQTNPGEYCMSLAQQNGCDSTVCQRLEWVPVAGTSALLICPGDSVEVFPGQVESVEGQYCKVFQNQLGCDSTHCTTLSVAEPFEGLMNDTLYIQQGDSIWLAGSLGLASYEWMAEGVALGCFNCQQVQVAPEGTSSYTLVVKNAAGCSDTLTYRVVVYPPCFEQLKVPNAFSPDGDGINDVFQIVPFEGLEKVRSLQVYNRWGQKIYQSTAVPSWDGMVGGKPAPVDVYLFILEVECNGVVLQLPQREVSLIR